MSEDLKTRILKGSAFAYHSICIENYVDLICRNCQELVKFSHFLFQCFCLNLNLTISFISEDLEIKCVAVSSILPPGENDMYDGMPELEEYDDVVVDLLIVDGLLQTSYESMSKQKKLRTMIDTLGQPTIFATHSFDDTHCLITLLRAHS